MELDASVAARRRLFVGVWETRDMCGRASSHHTLLFAGGLVWTAVG